MVIIRPALRVSGCAQGSSELSYRQVAARDSRVPEGIDRHSVSSTVSRNTFFTVQRIVPYSSTVTYYNI